MAEHVDIYSATLAYPVATVAADITVGALDLGNSRTKNCTRGIYVGGGGTLVATFLDAPAAITMQGLVPGFYPFAIKSITASGTTVTNLTLVF